MENGTGHHERGGGDGGCLVTLLPLCAIVCSILAAGVTNPKPNLGARIRLLSTLVGRHDGAHPITTTERSDRVQ